MANVHRGETSFRVGADEMFVVYGTREVAEMQAALGFCRPDPYAAVVVLEEDQIGKAGDVVRRRVLLTAAERQRRFVEAFDAVMMRPDPDAVMKILRAGLGRWERQQGRRLTDVQWAEVCDRLGLVRLNLIHGYALTNGTYLTGTDEPQEENPDPNAQSAASASSTSTTS